MAKNKKDTHLQVREPVLYKNYDLYDVGQKSPPVSFYQEMNKYKSVADYLKKKKRKNKKNKKMQRRKRAFLILASLDKNYIDFSMDDQTTPILEPSDTDSLKGANLIGVLDPYTMKNDFYDKNISNLNYGRDYPEEDTSILEEILENGSGSGVNISPAEYKPYGLPDGILGREETESTYDPQRYGNTNSGNTSYSHISW